MCSHHLISIISFLKSLSDCSLHELFRYGISKMSDIMTTADATAEFKLVFSLSNSETILKRTNNLV